MHLNLGLEPYVARVIYHKLKEAHSHSLSTGQSHTDNAEIHRMVKLPRMSKGGVSHKLQSLVLALLYIKVHDFRNDVLDAYDHGLLYA